MKDNYDVIIVGGGPTGSMAGIEISKLGYSVCILEKTRDIGYPVRCGEAVGHTGLIQFMEPKSNWIASKIMSIQLVSPKVNRRDAIFFIGPQLHKSDNQENPLPRISFVIRYLSNTKN